MDDCATGAVGQVKTQLKGRGCPAPVIQLFPYFSFLIRVHIKPERQVGGARLTKIQCQAPGPDGVTGENPGAGHGRDGVGQGGLGTAKHGAAGMTIKEIQWQANLDMTPVTLGLKNLDIQQPKGGEQRDVAPFTGAG